VSPLLFLRLLRPVRGLRLARRRQLHHLQSSRSASTTPLITGNTASCYSGSHRSSSGSEHLLHSADLSWTALFAAIGGPCDIYAYFASSGSGSEHRLIDSADYFRTAPSASMAGGIRFLD
jgi:hypothetical protein